MFFNRVKTFILLIGLSSILIILGKIAGGATGMQIALAISIFINLLAYFYSDKLVLKLYKAQPMSPEQYRWVYSITEELTSRMNTPMPKLWIIEAPMANAFATGRNPANGSVALTTGIINTLDQDELRGVIAHELAHIKNRDILIATIAATVATSISYLASMLRYSAIFGSNRRRNGSPLLMILMSIIMPIAAVIIQLSISRSREYLADETGAKYSQDPLALASALEKLHNASRNQASHANTVGKESTASLFIVHPFFGKNMINLFSTHPPIQKRIEKLKKMQNDMYHRT